MEVSSGPILTPSRANWTPATATLSEAVAETVTVPETVESFDGDVRETVGGVVSEGGEVVPDEETEESGYPTGFASPFASTT